MIQQGWMDKLKQNSSYQKTIEKYQKKPPTNPRNEALNILSQLSLK